VSAAPAAVLPVGLVLAGRRCVVVGGGAVGGRRAASLVAAGAEVVVVDPSPGAEVEELAAGGRATVLRRPADPDGDVPGAALVVCATGDPVVDAAVAAAAARSGALVNRADAAGAGDVVLPAVVDHGPLRVAVHGPVGRPAPAAGAWAAGRLRSGLTELLGLDAAATGLLVDVVAEVREELAGGGRSSATPGAADWRNGLDGTMLELICRGRRAEAKDHLLACLSSS
jgi:siroheme synthase-like protein